MTETFKLGKAKVEVGDNFTRTTIDGKRLEATHDPQPGQAETAAQHGLTAEFMNRDHDLAHSLLAALLGLPASPTLQGMAQGRHWEHWWREEAAVLALQGYANAAGVDLLEVARRFGAEMELVRNAETGRFATEEEAAADPARHIRERRKTWSGR